jgi:hypothetical protein
MNAISEKSEEPAEWGGVAWGKLVIPRDKHKEDL